MSTKPIYEVVIIDSPNVLVKDINELISLAHKQGYQPVVLNAHAQTPDDLDPTLLHTRCKVILGGY